MSHDLICRPYESVMDNRVDVVFNPRYPNDKLFFIALATIAFAVPVIVVRLE